MKTYRIVLDGTVPVHLNADSFELSSEGSGEAKYFVFTFRKGADVVGAFPASRVLGIADETAIKAET